MTDDPEKPQAGLARTLLKAVLAVTTAITLVLTIGQATYDYRAGLRSINERFEEINRTLSPGLSTALWGFDRETVASQAAGILHFPYVRYVEIRSDSDVVAAAGRRVVDNALVREFPLTFPHDGKTVVLGKLHLEADLSAFTVGILRNVTQTFMFQLLTVTLTCLFLLLMFNRLVTRHIAHAARHFLSMNLDGNLSPLVLEKKRSGDEIDILAEAFNALQEKLDVSYSNIKESEQRFKTLFEQVAVGVAEVETTTGRFVTANSRYCQIVGRPLDELLKMTSRELSHPDDAELQQRHIQMLIDNEAREFAMEKRYIRKDGSVVWVNLTITPMWQPGESPSHHIGVVEDITNRKQAEDKLLLLSQRLKLATASARLGVWDWNVRNNTMVWDERMLEIYAATEPPSFQLWLNGLHPDDSERAVAECRAALDGGPDFDTTFRIRRSDGTVRHIKAAGLVIRGADGATERMIGMNMDITDQVQGEEERKTVEAQLQQAQKMESVGRLAGGVAHDFNNMLSIILGRADLALMRLEPDHPLHDNLTEIRKTAARSADLTRQLLAFARKQTVSPKILDLNETIALMLKMLQRLIGEDVNLRWLPAPHLWPVKVDPTQIDQILANLCVNARDAIVNTGSIIIETSNCTITEDYCLKHPDAQPGQYVRLAVSDDGAGMDAETVAHAFEPFFTTKGLGKGTGLGLATVYGAVCQNNGFINIYSEPGRGTTFSIYLPRCEHPDAHALLEPPVTPVPRGQELILLVEDDPQILDVTALLLEEQGYRVIPTRHPDEALRVAGVRAENIDLLLTDVIMPGLNGRDLANRLLPGNPGMKVLFMSGYTSDVIAHRGVLEEGVNFIEKPFSLAAMATKVREVLDAKP